MKPLIRLAAIHHACYCLRIFQVVIRVMADRYDLAYFCHLIVVTWRTIGLTGMTGETGGGCG
jgi:hypothetical protein